MFLLLHVTFRSTVTGRTIAEIKLLVHRYELAQKRTCQIKWAPGIGFIFEIAQQWEPGREPASRASKPAELAGRASKPAKRVLNDDVFHRLPAS